ncbi:hypothetical protein BDP27DRAFT_1371538 [Rhodocollybia butyracea]|uniref:Uncharacterized protein n=1 Tax=Rhodocollybia butyracea TaxID=206335 RepID=A0A9P5PAT8_9AGAR|nr:hypothetical protein BDP27DRAFT_1371538 [Rhodocollybia butyracea]
MQERKSNWNDYQESHGECMDWKHNFGKVVSHLLERLFLVNWCLQISDKALLPPSSYSVLNSTDAAGDFLSDEPRDVPVQSEFLYMLVDQFRGGDGNLLEYESSSVNIIMSLASLNAGQSVIFSSTLTMTMSIMSSNLGENPAMEDAPDAQPPNLPVQDTPFGNINFA